MPAVGSQLSIDDFLARQQLMSDEASSNGQNSLRTSRSSLIKRKKTANGNSQWLPIAFAASLFGILATVSLLLVMACLAIRHKPCEEHPSPHVTLLRENSLKYIRLGYKVKTYNYSVLLNYPDFEHPNTVKVMNGDGTWWRLSRGRGHSRGPPQAVNEQLDGRSEVWWNAYSANGTVEGRVVYCNFGTVEDFRTLHEMGINVEGAIVLMRYGALARSEKVVEAEKRGAIGVILYSDPAQHSRTHLLSLAQQLNVEQWAEPQEILKPRFFLLFQLLPGIPVTPIGYDDAQKIMEYMDGPAVTRNDWIGGMSIYKWSSRRKFQLNVRSRFVKRTITNIIAMLEGAEEPDRWVMLGNHVDAWGKGAIDPLSGTAVQLEVARVAAKVFGTARPRRTIVFCHWDAEEFGLIGSSEFIEQRLGVLQKRAVAYINVDHIAGGSSLDIKAVPLLYRTIVEASQRTTYSGTSTSESLLDSWRHFRRRGPFVGDRAVPEIGLPAGGSDYQYMFLSTNTKFCFRAVAYINVDHIAGGSSLDIKAVPLLYRTIVEASQRTTYSGTSTSESLLDSWRHFRRRGPFVGDRAVPEIGLPAGGSDYQRFITFAGIPAADVKLEPRPGQSYALYHTMFETPWTVENIIDPNFSSLTSAGQLWLEIVHRLASSLVIPFNVLDYAQSLLVLFHKAEVQLAKLNLAKAAPWLPHKLSSLKEALRRLQNTARRIQIEAQVKQTLSQGSHKKSWSGALVMYFNAFY
ncbi:PA domain protein [Oesophagostomum dentatum]|uniref:PA domain protein n=1 Tax=Oesophagostomum dentatum TaxID=61180 RepID=A0A0B1TGA8_OESDE|nr:PA domain protein [Oesophagostomum dentatum]